MVAVLVGVAVALRLPGIESRSLWLDEAWRANLALAPSWAAFWAQATGDASVGGVRAPLPPIFALMLRAAALLAGPSAAALRAVPLLASVAAVPLAWVLVRRWAGVAGAAAAAFAFACYPTAIFHGRELKQYPLDVLVVLLLLWCAARVVERPARVGRWALYGAVAALTPGTSYGATLALPGLAIALAACAARIAAGRTGASGRRALAGWLVSHAGAGLAALVWYVAILSTQRARPHVQAYWAAGFPSDGGAGLVGWTAGQLLGFGRYALGEPTVLLVAAVLVGAVLLPRWLQLALATTLVVVVGAAARGLYPLDTGRTSLFLLPFVYLSLATLVGSIAATLLAATSPGRRALHVALGLGLAVLVAFPARGALHVRPVVEQTAPLIRRLAAERRPEDGVYVYYSTVPAFRFYHPKLDPGIVFGGSHRRDSAAYAPELRPLLQPGRRVWLVFSHIVAGEREVILGAMRLYGREIRTWERRQASLHLFEVTRKPGQVRHLRLGADDLRDPDALRKLLER